ncbi:MAG: hypothetical protein HY756_06355 [Nitrospirae bacterium]|nr:hypothetical protein [Nitrospirota bacterium]
MNKVSPPLTGGDVGEGEYNALSTPTLSLPRQGGGKYTETPQQRLWGIAFNEFKEKFDREEIPEPYSYDIETDYLEWEGLVSRLSKYKSLLNNLP